MSNFALIGGLAGGIGLFLLGMGLMTEGLKLAAGPALERILARSTRTRLRGLASGIAVTALVQSSTAVTVASIGFVNAGLLSLSQALWVLFGANVGTTMTGWLVALVGLKLKIDALALPMIGLGMALRLSGEGLRRGAAGTALAGFGVLFLGIDLLATTFSGVSSQITLPDGTDAVEVLALVLIGVVLTIVMQSSSAALAIALTAAQGGLLTPQGAAAVVIGANIGTTATALVAAIGATPNAKRVAAAHILFNLLTGVVALVLLPWLIGLLGAIREWLGLASSPAAKLALFHTVFNLLGVVLIWPMANALTRFLSQRFVAPDEDEARPVHLDRTVQAVPALAVDAVEREVRRQGGIAVRSLRALTTDAVGAAVQRDAQISDRLGSAIAAFITEANRAGMSERSAQRLTDLLRVSRYYEAAAELAAEAASAHAEATHTAADETARADARWRVRAADLLGAVSPDATGDHAVGRDQAWQALESAYQEMKSALLAAGVRGALPVETMDARLRSASALRRALDQTLKASRRLDPGRTPVSFRHESDDDV